MSKKHPYGLSLGCWFEFRSLRWEGSTEASLVLRAYDQH